MMHIDHPATQGESVSLWRWLKFHVGCWLGRIGQNMERRALYPNDDDIPF